MSVTTHKGRCIALAFFVTNAPGYLRDASAAFQRAETSQSGGLKIVVVEGEDAVNIVPQKTAVAPVIEVRDRNDLPVAGVPVTFSISAGGGTFGSAQTLTVVTNAAGRAVAAGLTPTANGALQIT